MKKYDTDETFLARWIAGELSDEELKEFEKTDAYKQFYAINKEAQQIESISVDTEKALHKVSSRLSFDKLRTDSSNTTKKQPKIIQWSWSIVASIALLIGAYSFLNSTKTYTTAIGEQQIIHLEDGSVITLNTNSSLSHKRFFWLKNKNVELQGEAYFDIQKGDGFSVTTSKGIVSVLGTEFYILDRSYTYKISCYEGKVKHETNDTTHILTQGIAYEQIGEKFIKSIFNYEYPSWKKEYSEFEKTPLSVVLKTIEDYYSITFHTGTIDTQQLFTGSFEHKNLNNALRTTLGAMKIEYSQSGTTIYLK